MASNNLITPIDKVGEYLKNKKIVQFSELEKKFHIPEEILRRWLVILEEYNIIKTKFENFKEEIIFNDKIKHTEENIDVSYLKSSFIRKAKFMNITYEKMNKLWKLFIKEYEDEIKTIFYNKAKSKGFPEQKINRAWLLYKKDLEEL